MPLPPGARGGITAQFLAPYEGDYELRATGNPAVFTVDGATVDTKGRTHLKAGLHTIVAANAGHSFVESEGELFGFVPGAAGTGYASTGIVGGGGGRRRTLAAAAEPAITVNGPFNPTGNPIDTTSRTRIFVCRAPDPKEETACASRILSNLAPEGFPPSRDRQGSRASHAVLQRRPQGRHVRRRHRERDWSRCLRAPSSCIARSRRRPTRSPGSIYRLNGTELASRLSFFLWSSIPDDELLAAAEQGKLSDPKVLEQQVRRMLADPRAKTLTTNFAFEWLKIRDMDALEPDPFVYPSLRRARSASRSAARWSCSSTASSTKTAAWWIC